MKFYRELNMEKYEKTMDEKNERLIREQQKYYFILFERMIDMINYLASHNLGLRDH